MRSGKICGTELSTIGVVRGVESDTVQIKWKIRDGHVTINGSDYSTLAYPAEWRVHVLGKSLDRTIKFLQAVRKEMKTKAKRRK